MSEAPAARPAGPPNPALQQTAAAVLVSRGFLFLSAAAAAELGRSAVERLSCRWLRNP